MLVPLLAVQWFAITNLALEARQHILQSCNAAYVLSTGSRRVLAVLPLYFSVSFSLSPSSSLNHTKTNQGQKYCSLALFPQLITRQCMLNLHLLATKITRRERSTTLISKTWWDKRELIRTWEKRNGEIVNETKGTHQNYPFSWLCGMKRACQRTKGCGKWFQHFDSFDWMIVLC